MGCCNLEIKVRNFESNRVLRAVYKAVTTVTYVTIYINISGKYGSSSGVIFTYTSVLFRRKCWEMFGKRVTPLKTAPNPFVYNGLQRNAHSVTAHVTGYNSRF